MPPAQSQRSSAQFEDGLGSESWLQLTRLQLTSANGVLSPPSGKGAEVSGVLRVLPVSLLTEAFHFDLVCFFRVFQCLAYTSLPRLLWASSPVSLNVPHHLLEQFVSASSY